MRLLGVIATDLEIAMKMKQQSSAFSAIALIVETADEAEALWELARFTDATGEALSNRARKLAVKISDWFSNEAKL